VGAEVMCVGLVEETGMEGVRFQYSWFAVYVKKERRFKLIFRQAKRETAEKGLESEKFGFADRGMVCLRQHYIGLIEALLESRRQNTTDMGFYYYLHMVMIKDSQLQYTPLLAWIT
jgi:hypothetical protein